MDIALAIDKLIPAAEYGGSVTANDQASYEAIRWADERPKPSWAELLAAYAPPAPPVVTMRQARLSLLGAGLLDDVEAALNAIGETKEGKAARIEWTYASEVHRSSEFVAMMGNALALDADALDALFVTAAGL